jgi:prepilin-type N-terminal cleavage/methylation domain-containing protein
MPTLPSDALASKRGYTLLEMLIALAIMGLAAAVILPSGATALDQIVVHTVFFDFQRQVSDLRSAAFAEQRDYALVSSEGSDASSNIVVVGAAKPTRERVVNLALRSGWQYRVSRPITISAGGACSDGAVDLISLQRVAAHLETHDGACHFIRVK